MLQHYPGMALRILFRHRLYSFINIAGMSIALASAILILLFVRDQLSYDAWIPHTAALFRLEETLHMLGRPAMPLAKSPATLLTEMKAQIPQVEAVTHVDLAKVTVQGRGTVSLDTATVVDPNFLQVIELPLRAGDPAEALRNSGSVVLSQSEARRYFGNADPIGKILTIGGLASGRCSTAASACTAVARPFTVTGVLRDLPHDTQLVADLVVSNAYRSQPAQSLEYNYVKLAPGADRNRVLQQVRSILDRSFDLRKFGINQSASDLEQMHLNPFRDVHLTAGRGGEMKPAGSRATIYGLGVIALLIVVVASCNFMNLTTARATLRMREIALRKICGASRGHLFLQFLAEAIVTVLLSLLLAVALAEMLLPTYGKFLHTPLELNSLRDWGTVAAILVGGIAIGGLSGIYPALVLSDLSPAAALKGESSRKDSTLVRAALVVGQFAVSIGLGVAVLIVFRQIDFVRSLTLGFDRDDIVVVRGEDRMTAGLMAEYARVLDAGPAIAGTTLSSAVPFDPTNFADILVRSPAGGGPLTAKFVSVGPRFTSVYGVRVLAGRPFSAAFGGDTEVTHSSRNVLINSALAHRLGYSPAGAIGKTLSEGQVRLDVVGVVDDAIFDGLREPVQPMVFLNDPTAALFLSIRLRHGQIPDALAFIDTTWRSLAHGVAIDRYFLNSAFDGLLTDDERQGEILGVFVAITLLIAALGLFGLAVFTSERRTKEIGIRRVSGARTRDLVWLMLWRISIPVAVANLIAWPVAYYYLGHWLQGYAYRIPLNPLYFLTAGAAALLIAWATVYANTLRLARMSPIHALRYE